MENQSNNQGTQENTSFNDQNQADRALKSKTNADDQVRENEEASLQDKEYSFDEDLTGNEEYHDAEDVEDESDF
jgi:hypothetical protein